MCHHRYLEKQDFFQLSEVNKLKNLLEGCQVVINERTAYSINGY
jgi:hypothetical protein